MLFLTIINSVVIANAQTLLWRVDDSTFTSCSGNVLPLPHDEMFVVANSCVSGGEFSVFKYDENGNAIFRKTFDQRDVTNQLLDADGNLMVAGGTPDTVIDAYVAKIDTNGNEVWEAPIIEPGYTFIYYQHDLAFDNSGNSYLASSLVYPDMYPHKIAIHKISNSGSLIWARYFGDTVNLLSLPKVKVTTDGKILIACQQQAMDNSSGYLQLLEYDSSGNMIWHHEITDDSNGNGITMNVSDLSVSSDGSIYVCGNARILYIGPWKDYPYVVKLDSSGNKIWLKEIFGHGTIISTAYGHYYTGALGDDGSYYAAGHDTLFQIVVVKFSSDGDIMWVMNHLAMYDSSSGNLYTVKIHNGYLFAGGILADLANQDDYLVIASDQSGNIRWTARYNSQNNDNNDLASLDLDNDNNVLVSGRTTKGGTTDMYTTTIKYSNTVDGVPDVLKDDVSIRVFPNPASEDISILSGKPSIKIKSLVISDACGRKIKEVLWTDPFENHIDVRDFPSGIYFIRAKTEEGKLFSGKFVKQ